MHLLQKCLLLTCVFLLCPKRSSFSPLSKNLRKVYKPSQMKILRSRRSSAEATGASEDDLQKHITGLDESEPGFDLTEEEITKFKIWPRGVIPYFIDDFSFDKVLRDRIRAFLDTVNMVTGLNFVELPRPPKEDESRWLFFINRRGLLDCADISTKNFSNSGVQKVVLGYNCMNSGAALAEIVLAIAGVPPQHNAPNRNDYVQVQVENILPDKKHLFDILKDDEWLFHDVDYDFYSAGHYDFHKYTVNGAATLRPVKVSSDLPPVGEGDGFSANDIWKIRMLYNYIVKKKQTKAPECYKLFQPGTNFSSFHPENEIEIEPRKKPNRYSGLQDDTPQNSGSKLNNKENENDDGDESENKNEVGDENTDDGKNDVDNAKDKDEKSRESGKDGDLNDNEALASRNKKAIIGKIRKLRPGKKQRDTYVDVLSQRSDYNTEEKKK